MKLRRLLGAALVMLILLACAWTALADEPADLSQFAGKRIGVKTATIFEQRVYEFVEDPQSYSFATDNDCYLALKNGKLDGIISDEPILRYMAKELDDLQVSRIETDPDYIGMISSKDEKGQAYIDQLNAFLKQITENGEMDALYERWFVSTQEPEPIPYDDLPAVNGVLRIGTEATYAPFQFIKNGIVTGYETELLVRFCEEYGYRPEFSNVNFDGLIAGVAAGKYDVAAACFTITEERKQSVLFTDPVFVQYPGIAYLKEADSDFFTSLFSGFRRTFLEDGRGRMFVGGCLVTLKITVLSFVIGTLLGFLVHEIYRKRYKAAVWAVNFLEWLFDGMPVVVFLMILYYVVLGKTSLGGEEVSTVCFTLLFASSVRQMLEIGEAAIDPGQAIAARALGYTQRQTNRLIILPQSVKYILPNYISAVSSHIKATAVVGYVAVLDLTKVGDIVRGATYEASIPLIAVAVMYFVLADILKLIVRLIARAADHTRRTPEQILKGAKIQ